MLCTSRTLVTQPQFFSALQAIYFDTCSWFLTFLTLEHQKEEGGSFAYICYDFSRAPAVQFNVNVYFLHVLTKS